MGLTAIGVAYPEPRHQFFGSYGMQQTVGQRLGHYELRQPLGSGGLGTVYEAIDGDTGEAVAVKMFRTLSPDPDAVDRFLEIQGRLRDLRHQRLVRVLDCGLERGQPWVAMEAAVSSLRTLGEAPLRPESAVRVAVQVAEALQALHGVGILHGNLKLSNVLFDTNGNVLVTDVGTDILGRGASEAYRAIQTTPSPAYMSPEQARGEPTGERSDIYSLGILLFVLLTGEVPFWGYDASTVLVKRELAGLTPPSRLNPDVPAVLDRIVHMALALAPEDRYATASAFAADLQDLYPGPIEPAVTPDERAGPPEVVRRRLDEGLRVVCPICDFGNPHGRTLCLNCWSPLARGEVITVVEDDRRTEAFRRRAAVRRRLELAATAAFVLVVLVAIYVFVQFNRPPPTQAPTTNVSVSSAPGQWASLGRTPERLSSDAGAPPIAGRIRWTFETTTQIYSSPAAAGGRVYLAAGDRRIIALQSGSGTVIWQSPTNGPVDSTPAVAGGRLYVGLRDGNVISIDTATGERVWAHLTRGPISASPTVADGTVYVGSGDRSLYAFDAATGALRWEMATDGWLASSPAVGETIVAIGGRDWAVYTADKASGQPVLTYRLGFSPTEATPAVIGDTVYIGASDHALRALDGRTSISWLDEEWRVIRSQLYDWGIAGQPPESKGLLWKFTAVGRRDNRITGVLAVSDSTVYVGAWDNRLYAVSREDGSERWRFAADAPIVGGPSLAGDTVYIVSFQGTVYAVDAESGEKRWSLSLPTRVTSTPAVGDGLLFVTGVNGILYALE